MATLRSYFRQPATSAVAAMLCCGVYFVICRGWHLTQVEGLVGLPLYLSAWLLLKKPASEPLSMPSFFFAGVATAFMILFKLVLVVQPCCFLILLIASNFYHRKSVFKSFMAILIFGIGIALILLPVLAYFESNNQLILIYKTFIEYPARITRELPHNKLAVFRSGIIWFATRLGPLVPLALVGAWNRRDLFGRGMVVWIVVGFGLILLQRMGWEYHFLLLLCPLAILAAAGIETIIQSRSLTWIPIVLLLPYAGMEAVEFLQLRHDPRPEFYSDVATDAALVRDTQLSTDPIYVLGNPLIYYLSDRTQAVAINGWSPEWLLDEQWNELALSLRVKQPTYIFVDWRDNPSVADRGQAFVRVLDDKYHQVAETPHGEWYQLGKRVPR
jgi:hypothetical protein